jgi:hypothetical protein
VRFKSNQTEWTATTRGVLVTPDDGNIRTSSAAGRGAGSA